MFDVTQPKEQSVHYHFWITTEIHEE